ncbi:acyl carrier protein [Nocardia amikacinitolerans]|uniref:Acyl carrier protein n=1 Tax=Nocardia amikacinitolerans TaxID=756689 RepID=A0A285KV52_9NOCA|nr:acyl carrier protein [Nocardia amikacinitolerans]MCP2275916.1 acyl carrier protein [Nocardia amikacinitolerans]MCP2289684.1 acyl carrier protein [Nocardia amikacinitolerans]MCP2294187.1 acyl carrier protein [Nocardia amikacinitolerans]MCP2314926.1 acyl carrier protein [Nocardia amikacinitolerans]SNY76534.1 acyl carrier protein [Nocardia amikacinitolerans]
MSAQTRSTAEIEARVRGIVGEVLWVAADDIDAGTQLIDYGLDSPTAIELTIQLEQAFAIEIPEDVAAQLNTVAEIVEYVRSES